MRSGSGRASSSGDICAFIIRMLCEYVVSIGGNGYGHSLAGRKPEHYAEAFGPFKFGSWLISASILVTAATTSLWI